MSNRNLTPPTPPTPATTPATTGADAAEPMTEAELRGVELNWRLAKGCSADGVLRALVMDVPRLLATARAARASLAACRAAADRLIEDNHKKFSRGHMVPTAYADFVARIQAALADAERAGAEGG